MIRQVLRILNLRISMIPLPITKKIYLKKGDLPNISQPTLKLYITKFIHYEKFNFKAIHFFNSSSRYAIMQGG